MAAVTTDPAVLSPDRPADIHPVGHNPPKADAWGKVTGRTQYTDDLDEPGVIHGATVRSSICRGKIKEIRFGEGVNWDEFTIVQAKDIPAGGENVVALIEDDQPCLAHGRVEHKHEPIILLAHPDREQLLKGVKAVQIVYEKEEPALDYRAASFDFKKYRIFKGDPASAFARKDLVVLETEWEVPHQEQLYIEPQAMIAKTAPDGSIHIRGSLQCPFYVDKAVARLFGIAPEKVRVEQVMTGGGFGGKEEYPSMLAGHAALLAWKSGKPVKMLYDREEDIQATTKRHPAWMKIKSASTPEGELVALDVEIVMDGGAYATLTSVVLSRGTLHASGPYRWPNVDIRAKAVRTNTPPNGAFRGFGAPQTCFGIEMHMSRLAEKHGLEPLEFRRRNVLRLGDQTATGQTLEESVSAIESIDATKALCDYDNLIQKADAFNAKGGPLRYGVGVATFFHGAGFTGSGETMLASKAAVELTEDGRPRVLAASTEIGQGAATNFQQFAAEALGLPAEAVEVAAPDTSVVPNSGPTVASRTTMIVGGLIYRAARQLREALESEVGNGWKTLEEFQKLSRAYLQKRGPLRCETQYETPQGIAWDEKNYRGSAYACYGWACAVVELMVDLRTLETRLLRLSTAQDVGKAVHPILCAGQVEGGSLQALGWGLLEETVFVEGEYKNATLTNYIIPTSLDSPPMTVTLLENPTKYSPLGAKGIGEMPMDGPAGAVAHAIARATGIWIKRIPATPERLLKTAQEQGIDLNWRAR